MELLIHTSMNEAKKKRKQRSDKGTLKLSARDLRCLRFIGEQYAVRFDQLQVLAGAEPGKPTREVGKVAYSTALSLVNRWRKMHLVEYRKFFLNEPHWVWLTREGIELIGLPYRVWEANALSLAHIYWVNQVRFYAQRRYPAARWISERDLKYEEGRKAHVPDAELDTGDGTVAIEVELTRKKPMRLALILRQLLTDYKNGTIWYFTNHETNQIVKAALLKFREEQQKQFRVYLLEVTN